MAQSRWSPFWRVLASQCAGLLSWLVPALCYWPQDCCWPANYRVMRDQQANAQALLAVLGPRHAQP